MNIGIISRHDVFPPVHGAAAKIVSTAKFISLLGHRVVFISNEPERYHVFENGSAHAASYPQWLTRSAKSSAPLRELLRMAGLGSTDEVMARLLDRVGLPRPEQFLYRAVVDPNFYLRVFYLAFAERLSVLQAEFPGYAAPAVLAGILLGAQTSIVEHNVEHQRLAETIDLPREAVQNVRFIETTLLRLVDHVVVVSEVDGATLRRLGISAKKIRFIPHGVDIEEYKSADGGKVRRRYGIGPSTPVLIFHGTYHYQPNVEAVAFIAEKLLPALARRGVKPVAICPGQEPPQRYKRDEIIFPGPVLDLPDHIAAADVALVPILTGGGTRMKILEYFAGKVPVVSTVKGAEGYPLRNGRNILFADEHGKFAAAVADLLRNREKAREVARNAFEFVKDYDWREICGRYVRMYQAAEKKE